MNELEPVINTLNAPFWEAARNGELVLPWCAATRRFFWPPSPRSPYSFDTRIEWRSARSRGVLVAAVAYRRSFMKSLDPVMPYAVGQVELDDGPRLLVHLRDVALAAPECAGTRVHVYFDSIVGGSPKVPMARTAKET
jgi:uncharacterized OB-fold protein